MKLKASLVLLLSLLSIKMISQTAEGASPKGKFFCGLEIGSNTISSFSQVPPNASFDGGTSLQGGISAEYYFSKRWSVTARVKSFNTGTVIMSSSVYGVYSGIVVSVPVNVKWEFNIEKNLKGYLKFGPYYQYEYESKNDFGDNPVPDYPKDTWGVNPGLGFDYFLSEKMAIYGEVEFYTLGGYRGNNGGFITPKNYYTENTLLNIGVKYSFGKGGNRKED